MGNPTKANKNGRRKPKRRLWVIARGHGMGWQPITTPTPPAASIALPRSRTWPQPIHSVSKLRVSPPQPLHRRLRELAELPA